MRNWEHYLVVVAAGGRTLLTDGGYAFSRRQHRRPQTHTLVALQNSWIWELLLVLALCAALAFFLIEVWQIVEFIYR